MCPTFTWVKWEKNTNIWIWIVGFLQRFELWTTKHTNFITLPKIAEIRTMYFRFFTRNTSWAMEILLYYGVESFRLVFVWKFDTGKRVERMRKKDVNTLQCAVAKYLNVTEKIRIRKIVDGFQWISAVKFVYGDIKPHAKVRRTYMKMEAKLLYWPFFIVLLLCKGAAE
jgi:hypothetical protein